jgi:hypothetical protein
MNGEPGPAEAESANRTNGVQLRPARYDTIGMQKSLYPKPIDLAPQGGAFFVA